MVIGRRGGHERLVSSWFHLNLGVVHFAAGTKLTAQQAQVVLICAAWQQAGKRSLVSTIIAQYGLMAVRTRCLPYSRFLSLSHTFTIITLSMCGGPTSGKRDHLFSAGTLPHTAAAACKRKFKHREEKTNPSVQIDSERTTTIRTWKLPEKEIGKVLLLSDRRQAI